MSSTTRHKLSSHNNTRRYSGGSPSIGNSSTSSGSTTATITSSSDKPHFSSSFPSAPRRQPPTLLNDVNFYGGGASNGNGNYNGNGKYSSGYNDYDDGSIPSFRQPGATERALANLHKAKYERQERKRAVILLSALLGLVAMMHVSTHMNNFLFGKMTVPEGNNNNNDWNFRGKSIGGDIDIKVQTAEGVGGSNGNNEGGDGGGDSALEEEEAFDPFFGAFKSLANVYDEWKETDIPFFWHIPRCAGSTVKDIMGQCMALVSASEVGVREGHEQDPVLQVIDYKGGKYVNVDTTSIQGIERAKTLGLAPSGVADVVVSSYLHEAASIFDIDHRGRAFLMLRNPVDRAVSMYHYMLQERPEMADVSLQDFARGQGIENNWMVRFMVNQMEGELDKNKLELAKQVMKEKFLIGFVDEKEESIKRFQKFAGWDEREETLGITDDAEDCITNVLSTGVNVSPPYELPKKGSQEWALITHQTQYDLKLYDYALELFDEQTKKFGSKEWKKAEKKKKKEKGGK